jgi:hypothetical protein
MFHCQSWRGRMMENWVCPWIECVFDWCPYENYGLDMQMTGVVVSFIRDRPDSETERCCRVTARDSLPQVFLTAK